MLWLNRVTALLSGQLTRLVKAIAQQMQTVGLALPEHTTRVGNNFSAHHMLLQHLHVPTQPSQSKEAVPSTKSAVKRGKKKTTASTTKALIAAGSKSAAPASQPRQPVKQAAKPAKKAASKTKAATKHIQDKAPARTRMVNRSGVNGN